MTADDAVTSALKDLAAALDTLAAPAMIIGGLAVIARGVPRTTLDIDATVWAEGLDVGPALEVFASHGFTARVPDARRFAEAHQVMLLRHERSGTPVDVSLAWLPFEKHALACATRLDLGGTMLPVASAEDLIIYKAVAWRPRDRDDIERLLAAHGADVDMGRIRELVTEFSALLDDPGRAAEFEQLLGRIGLGR